MLPRWYRQLARHAHHACSSECQTLVRVPAVDRRCFLGCKSRRLRSTALVNRLRRRMVQGCGTQSGLPALRACSDPVRPVTVCRCACVPYLWIVSSVSERTTSLFSADAKTLSMELTTKRMEAVSFARESNAHRLPPACATVERVCVRSRLERE